MDGVKIQSDGKIKVKIKISEGLSNRTGADIVHIADDGTVTSMNVVVEGTVKFAANIAKEYLTFTKDNGIMKLNYS